MPIIERIEVDENVVIGTWKITESESFFISRFNLTTFDKEEIQRMSAGNKRLQWLASRYLLKLLLQTDEIIYLLKDKFGKPYVKGRAEFVSISHCGDHVAVIVSNRQAGIDIEKLDKRIERISHRFLKKWERHLLENDPRKLYKLTLYWSAKESLYKWYGKKGLTFKTQLLIDPFDVEPHGKLNARLVKNGHAQSFEIHYLLLDQFVLTYTLNRSSI